MVNSDIICKAVVLACIIMHYYIIITKAKISVVNQFKYTEVQVTVIHYQGMKMTCICMLLAIKVVKNKPHKHL